MDMLRRLLSSAFQPALPKDPLLVAVSELPAELRELIFDHYKAGILPLVTNVVKRKEITQIVFGMRQTFVHFTFTIQAPAPSGWARFEQPLPANVRRVKSTCVALTGDTFMAADTAVSYTRQTYGCDFYGAPPGHYMINICYEVPL
jgi:hypothetical protein